MFKELVQFGLVQLCHGDANTALLGVVGDQHHV